jgi:EpsI family protein
VIARRFENGSEGVELIVVAGHKKRTVHTPGYCMPGDGWEVLTQVPHRMKVAGRPVPAMRSLMVKDRDRLLVTYFFTDGAYSTNNLLRFQGHQLVKRVRRVLPIGALVRMTVPVSTTPEAAGRLTDDFAARALPGVLQRLEQAHASI